MDQKKFKGERLPGTHFHKKPPVERDVVSSIPDSALARIKQRNIFNLLEKGLAKKGTGRRSVRVAIFLYLLDASIPGRGGNGELTVTELAEKMGRSVFQVSPVLRELYVNRVVIRRKQVNHRFYQLSPQAKAWWKALSGV